MKKKSKINNLTAWIIALRLSYKKFGSMEIDGEGCIELLKFLKELSDFREKGKNNG